MRAVKILLQERGKEDLFATFHGLLATAPAAARKTNLFQTDCKCFALSFLSELPLSFNLEEIINIRKHRVATGS